MTAKLSPITTVCCHVDVKQLVFEQRHAIVPDTQYMSVWHCTLCRTARIYG